MATQKEILGTDIKLSNGDIQFDFNQDFKKVTGKENLAQALKNRLNTGSNELSYYDNYGSRLINLIGEPDSILVRNEARGYIFETVANEPRVQKIESTSVEFNKDTISAGVNIVAITDDKTTNLVFNIEE